MNRVLIVDDETIVRVTLRSLVDWESLGYTVVKDCMNGGQALEYLLKSPVELLITDMKMPGMDGLELMEAVNREGKMPVTLVLSGYNEFELVRKAFRMGAYDYLLKSDLNGEALKAILERLNQTIFQGSAGPEPDLGSGRVEIPRDGRYGIVLFEVTDFKRQAARFGEDLDEGLARPMLELARQIPRLTARGGIIKVYPSQFLLYYKVTDETQYPSSIQSLVRQLQTVWRDYMNLSVRAGISRPVAYTEIDEALGEDIGLLKWSALSGSGGVAAAWEFSGRLAAMERERQRTAGLLEALFSGDSLRLEEEKGRFLAGLNRVSPEEAREECLHLVCQLADQFKEYENDFASLFSQEVDYFQKLGRLKQIRELELWVNNYIRWVWDYLKNCREDWQGDAILRARQFLADNFASAELTLKSAADYVGLNEKYFSAKFTRETGMTFSSYLTGLRLEKAKQLMDATDLKMYEISDRVGYHNVEHFNRMFKRHCGISPGDYRKRGKNV